ncbi:ATP-binding protein [Streptomyces sp. NPDC088253]|uniref:ATP-binding protein n=1 Tax=Streptomyces sp. NPDC088253 TaxID=3365846 RepID=UPI0037FDA1D6
MNIKREISSQGDHPENAPDAAETAASWMNGVVARSAPPVPPNAAAAREAVTELLTSRSCGLEGEKPADVVVADALLVTSELVTNAFRHGGGLTGFAAELTDKGLRIAVGDASTRAPVVQEKGDAGAAQIGGYGWLLVRRVATNISIAFHPGGKHITALIPLT